MDTLTALKRRMKQGDRLLCVENTKQTDLSGTTRLVVGVRGTSWEWVLERQDNLTPRLQAMAEQHTIATSGFPKGNGYSRVDDDTFRLALDGGHHVELRFLPR